MDIRKYLSLFFLFAAGVFSALAQDVPEVDAVRADEEPPAIGMEVQVGKAWYRGDSIPHVIMPTFYKYPPMKFIMVVETYEVLQTLPTKEARAAHLQKVEADLKRTYTPTLKRLTRSQGRLLVKLIDRECGQTGYNIAQAFIGSFKANLYQGIAVVFGQSLTKRYDPEGDDRYTERIVRLVESGQL